MGHVYVNKIRELLSNVSVFIRGDLDTIATHEIMRSVKEILLEIPEEKTDWTEVVPIRINLARINFTLGHYAAITGTLPKGFRAWSIKALVGGRSVSVAEVAARFNSLPEDFNEWAIADEKGWSAAHVYASMRPMPENFNQWDISTVKGVTVRDLEAHMKQVGYPQ